MTKTLTNKTKLEIFDSFTKTEYYQKLIAICPLLGNVNIVVVDYKESEYKQASRFNNNDALVCHIPERKITDLPIYAEILTNEDMIHKLNLSENEIFAAIAHEIGHIIINVETKGKIKFPKEFEEIWCDNYACQIGLAESMCSLLHKLLDKGESLLLSQKILIPIRITKINDYILCHS